MSAPLLAETNASPRSTQVHWLVRAVKRAALSGSESLALGPSVSIAIVWDTTARALGLSSYELAAALSATLHLRVSDLNAADRQALRLIPERLARRHNVFPIRENDRTITVATADPYDLDAEGDIGFAAGRRVLFELAPPHEIEQAIASAYSPDRAAENLLTTISDSAADDVRVIAEEAPEQISGKEVEAGPVVRLTNLIIATAVRQRASDIHIEPSARSASIRFRIDGVLRHHLHVPLPVMNRIVSRIKVLARLDIADRLRPQDGRTRLQVDGVAIDLRVSTIPTRDAEKAVIRLLRPDGAPSLDKLGMAAPELAQFRNLIGQRDGIVIVTGPTGSGKTTTLYGAIRQIADGTVNLMTVEDPIEYELIGITQMQVEPKRGVTFATALRAILRQDPDVIFVGEIRDLETAQIAVQASLTGHLVLATLHTNDAVGAVARLADLGLDRAAIASTFRGCVAQRLVRRVCPDCAQPVGATLTNEERDLARRFDQEPVMRAVGCTRCANTGYWGRVPVDEVVTFTPALTEMIAQNASGSTLQRAVTAAGMRSMTDVALSLVRDGVTTLQEVDRVLGDHRETNAETPVVKVERGRDESAQKPIVIVDDDPVQQMLQQTILENSGYTVLAASDGAEALRILAERPDVTMLLTDVHMPVMDGATLLARVRANAATATLPVVVLTGSGDGSSELELMDAGADDYMRKPVDPPRLLARVRAALRRANAS